MNTRMLYKTDTKNKCRCIICGQYKERSLEHIIPKALGNETLKTTDVCKDCNSKLGDNIDSYLNNHMLIQIIRRSLGLAGQSGKIPNPFRNGVDDTGQRMVVDDDLKPHVVPCIETEGNVIRIIAETKEQAVEIGLKKLNRIHAPEEVVQDFLEKADAAQIQTAIPKLSYKVDVDFNRLYLAALKIAYEYAWVKLGEPYRADPTAEKIREVLYAGMQGNYEKRYKKVQLVPNEMADIIRQASHLNCHMVTLMRGTENQMIANVILFMAPAFSFSVCVSDYADRYCRVSTGPCFLDMVDIHSSEK